MTFTEAVEAGGGFEPLTGNLFLDDEGRSYIQRGAMFVEWGFGEFSPVPFIIILQGVMFFNSAVGMITDCSVQSAHVSVKAAYGSSSIIRTALVGHVGERYEAIRRIEFFPDKRASQEEIYLFMIGRQPDTVLQKALRRHQEMLTRIYEDHMRADGDGSLWRRTRIRQLEVEILRRIGVLNRHMRGEHEQAEADR